VEQSWKKDKEEDTDKTAEKEGGLRVRNKGERGSAEALRSEKVGGEREESVSRRRPYS